MHINLLIDTASAAIVTTMNIPGAAPIVTGYDWINEVFRFATTTLGPILGSVVVMLGAYKYTTSGGDSGKTKEGLELILGALLGYTILLLANLLIQSLTIAP
jgi:hypothetical protein